MERHDVITAVRNRNLFAHYYSRWMYAIGNRLSMPIVALMSLLVLPCHSAMAIFYEAPWVYSSTYFTIGAFAAGECFDSAESAAITIENQIKADANACAISHGGTAPEVNIGDFPGGGVGYLNCMPWVPLELDSTHANSTRQGAGSASTYFFGWSGEGPGDPPCPCCGEGSAEVGVSASQWRFCPENAHLAFNPDIPNSPQVCEWEPQYFIAIHEAQQQEQNLGTCENENGGAGNPINPITGNKYQSEALVDSRLGFAVFYNSQSPYADDVGQSWSHSYSTRIEAIPNATVVISPPLLEFSSTYSTPAAACSAGWEELRLNWIGTITEDWFANSTAQIDTATDRCQILYPGSGGSTVRTSISVYNNLTALPYTSSGNQAPEIHIHREDGKRLKFRKVGGVWSSESGRTEQLTALQDGGGTTIGWTYRKDDDQLETFDASGQLVSIATTEGYTKTLSYVAGVLDRVDSTIGESLIFTYNLDGTMNTIIDHAGRQWQLSYAPITGGANLTGFTNLSDFPPTSRSYSYEDATGASLLTAIDDERGIRYANYDYDSQGRAIASYHGPQTTVLTDRIDGVSIQYNANGDHTITNSNGEASTYTTETQLGVPLVVEVSGPGCTSCGGGDVSYVYDPANNNLLSRTRSGITTAYGSYNSQGNPGFMIEAQGTAEERQTDYGYDISYHDKVDNIRTPSVFTGLKKDIRHTYDGFGNIISTVITGRTPAAVAVSRTITYQFNGPLNQLTQIDGPRVNLVDITTLEYYPNDVLEGDNRAQLKKITGPTGIIERDNVQYTATRKVQSEVRPNGLDLSYIYYPGSDWLETLTETAGLESRVTRWTYLASGEVASITTGDGTADATTISFTYDDGRRLTKITDGLGNYLEYVLDTEGNRIEENHYDSANTLHNALTQTFDIYNRLDGVTQANEVQNLNFASDGTLDLQTDGNNILTDFSYDSLLRLINTTEDQGGVVPDTANTLTQYGYDVGDRLTSVNDPNGNVTNYVYDDLNNLRSTSSPDTGNTAYNYDNAGNVTTRDDAKGQRTFYIYDAANRLLTVNPPGTADDLSYTYDSCINGVGRLCSITADSVVTTYAYDGFGNVTAHQGVNYTYDNADRLQSLTYPSGAIVSYQYDGAGQVSGIQLTRNGNTEDLASNVQYLPFGPITSLDYGNGTILTQSFDSAYRATAQTISGVLDLSYPTYDAVGNLQQRNDTAASPALQDYTYDALNRLDTAAGSFGSRDYDYDKNGNRSQVNDGAITSYFYEPNSNRLDSVGAINLQMDANGNTITEGTRTFSYTTHNRLLQVHDNASLIATYTYNGLGQRVSKAVGGTDIQYHYGTDGALLAESDQATGTAIKEYVHLNGTLLAILDNDSDSDGLPDALDNCIHRANGPLKADNGGFSQRDTDGDGYGNYCDADLNNNGFINSLDLGILSSVFFTTNADADFDGSGFVNSLDLGIMGTLFFQPPGLSGVNGEAGPAGVHYVHTDHLGTPVVMTDSVGTVVWRAEYDPFGFATVNSDTDGDGTAVENNVRFPGQYFDIETGLHYNYFRYYDPSTGRYLSSDLIGLAGGLNTYLYANANSLTFTDPYGLYCLTQAQINAIASGIGGGVGGLVSGAITGATVGGIPGAIALGLAGAVRGAGVGTAAAVAIQQAGAAGGAGAGAIGENAGLRGKARSGAGAAVGALIGDALGGGAAASTVSGAIGGAIGVDPVTGAVGGAVGGLAGSIAARVLAAGNDCEEECGQ